MLGSDVFRYSSTLIPPFLPISSPFGQGLKELLGGLLKIEFRLIIVTVKSDQGAGVLKDLDAGGHTEI